MANPIEDRNRVYTTEAITQMTSEERIAMLRRIILENAMEASAEEIKITDKMTDDYETTKVGANTYEK